MSKSTVSHASLRPNGRKVKMRCHQIIELLSNSAAIIKTNRVPLMLSLIVSFAVSTPNQVTDIYRAIAQDAHFDANSTWITQTLSGIISLFLFCFVVRLMTIRRCLHLKSAKLKKNIPRLVATIPLISTFAGLYLAKPSKLNTSLLAELRPVVKHATGDFNIDESLNDVVDVTTRYYFYDYNNILSIALFLLVFFVVLANVLERNGMRYLHLATRVTKKWNTQTCAVVVPTGVKRIYRWVHNRLATRNIKNLIFTPLTASLFLYAALTISFYLSPIALPETLGAISIFLLFCSLACLFLGHLSEIADRTGVPMVLGLLLLPVALSISDLNNNHDVRLVDDRGSSTNDGTGQNLKRAFANWFSHRHYSGKSGSQRFPVYLVAAQGGGMYAAAHSALFLSGLRDRCPGFTHHLFGISGVSGGSVGASIFASIASAHSERLLHCPLDNDGTAWQLALQNPVKFSVLAEKALTRDFLSPLVASWLFGDFFQRFFPIKIPPLDRTRALEFALEESLLVKEGREVLRGKFSNHWSAASDVPALFLNTTRVGSGRRFIFSPFTMSNTTADIAEIWDGPNFRGPALSTAAIASARFPWITPAGRFRNGALGEVAPSGGVSLVDGGYVDNSGVYTALDIAHQILSLGLPIELNLLVLTKGGRPNQTEAYLKEFSPPLLAMLNARSARGFNAIHTARKLAAAQPDKFSVHVIRLKDTGHLLPLGWRLSDASLSIIFGQNGVPSSCHLIQASTDCIVRKIFKRINELSYR